MSLNVRESIRQYFQNIFDKFFCYSTLTQSKPVEEIDSFFQMRHENMSKVKVMIFYIFASSSNLGENWKKLSFLDLCCWWVAADRRKSSIDQKFFDSENLSVEGS